MVGTRLAIRSRLSNREPHNAFGLFFRIGNREQIANQKNDYDADYQKALPVRHNSMTGYHTFS
jgi:hypothetical protein